MTTPVFLTIDTELMWRHHAEGLDRAEIYSTTAQIPGLVVDRLRHPGI